METQITPGSTVPQIVKWIFALMIIGVIICGLIMYHNTTLRESRLDAIKTLQSENDSIKNILIIKQKQADLLQSTIDTLTKSIGVTVHDTIIMHDNYETKKNHVAHLGADSSIDLFTKRIHP